MPDLYVILKTPLVGPDVNLVAGDQYPVQSQEQGDLMVSRELAAWPEPEKPTKKAPTKAAEPAVEQPSDTTVATDSSESQPEPVA